MEIVATSPRPDQCILHAVFVHTPQWAPEGDPTATTSGAVQDVAPPTLTPPEQLPLGTRAARAGRFACNRILHPYTQLPPELPYGLAQVRAEKPAWVISVPPSSKYVAVASESKLVLRSQRTNYKGREVTCASIQHDRDPAGQFVAWAPGGEAVLVAHSGGIVTMHSQQGELLGCVTPHHTVVADEAIRSFWDPMVPPQWIVGFGVSEITGTQFLAHLVDSTGYVRRLACRLPPVPTGHLCMTFLPDATLSLNSYHANVTAATVTPCCNGHLLIVSGGVQNPSAQERRAGLLHSASIWVVRNSDPYYELLHLVGFPSDSMSPRVPPTVQMPERLPAGTRPAPTQLGVPVHTTSMFAILNPIHNIKVGVRCSRRLVRAAGYMPLREVVVVHQVVATADGSAFATLDSTGRAVIWDTLSGSPLLSIGRVLQLLATDNAPVPRILGLAWWSADTLTALLSDGQIIAVAKPDPATPTVILNKFGRSPDLLRPPSAIVAPGDGKKFFALECALRRVVRQWSQVGEDDPVAPDTHSQGVIFRSFKLLSVVQVTPAELMATKLKTGAFADALHLATQFDLGTDPVYQAQWTSDLQPLSMDRLTNALACVRNDDWVLAQCANVRVTVGPPTGLPGPKEALEFLKALYQFGLERAEASTHPLAMDYAGLFRHYSKLLKILPEVWAFEGLPFNVSEFYNSRDLDLVRVATFFAESSRLHALEALFRYCPELYPYRLAVLVAIPETVSPHRYSHLLPCALDVPLHGVVEFLSMESGQVHRVRVDDAPTDVPDACKSIPVDTRLSWLLDPQMCIAKLDEYGIAPLAFWQADVEVISAWFYHRALAIDTMCGQLDFAVAMCVLGLARVLIQVPAADQLPPGTPPFHLLIDPACPLFLAKRQQLVSLFSSLSELARLVFTCGMEASMSASVWTAMAPRDRLVLMLDDTAEMPLDAKIRTRVLPVIAASSAAPHLGNWELMLRDVLVSSVNIRGRELVWLQRVLAVVSSSKPTLAPSQRIISSWASLMQLVLDVSYAMPYVSSEQWAVIANMIQCLPARSPAVVERHPDLLPLLDGIDMLEKHLAAAEILERYNMARALVFFQECIPVSDAAAQLASQSVEGANLEASVAADPAMSLLVKLCRHGVSHLGDPQLEDADKWLLVLEDATRVQQDAFPWVPKALVLRACIHSMLVSGQIELASHVLQSDGQHLTPAMVEAVVLDAAKEHFNGAPSLDHVDVSLAEQCLDLLPLTGNAQVQRQRNLVKAARIVHSCGGSLIPAQLDLIKPSIKIIEHVLEKRPAEAEVAAANLMSVSKFDESEETATTLWLASDAYAMILSARSTLDDDGGPRSVTNAIKSRVASTLVAVGEAMAGGAFSASPSAALREFSATPENAVFPPPKSVATVFGRYQKATNDALSDAGWLRLLPPSEREAMLLNDDAPIMQLAASLGLTERVDRHQIAVRVAYSLGQQGAHSVAASLLHQLAAGPGADAPDDGSTPLWKAAMNLAEMDMDVSLQQRLRILALQEAPDAALSQVLTAWRRGDVEAHAAVASHIHGSFGVGDTSDLSAPELHGPAYPRVYPWYLPEGSAITPAGQYLVLRWALHRRAAAQAEAAVARMHLCIEDDSMPGEHEDKANDDVIEADLLQLMNSVRVAQYGEGLGITGFVQHLSFDVTLANMFASLVSLPALTEAFQQRMNHLLVDCRAIGQSAVADMAVLATLNVVLGSYLRSLGVAILATLGSTEAWWLVAPLRSLVAEVLAQLDVSEAQVLELQWVGSGWDWSGDMDFAASPTTAASDDDIQTWLLPSVRPATGVSSLRLPVDPASVAGWLWCMWAKRMCGVAQAARRQLGRSWSCKYPAAMWVFSESARLQDVSNLVRHASMDSMEMALGRRLALASGIPEWSAQLLWLHFMFADRASEPSSVDVESTMQVVNALVAQQPSRLFEWCVQLGWSLLPGMHATQAGLLFRLLAACLSAPAVAQTAQVDVEAALQLLAGYTHVVDSLQQVETNVSVFAIIGRTTTPFAVLDSTQAVDARETAKQALLSVDNGAALVALAHVTEFLYGLQAQEILAMWALNVLVGPTDDIMPDALLRWCDASEAARRLEAIAPVITNLNAASLSLVLQRSIDVMLGLADGVAVPLTALLTLLEHSQGQTDDQLEFLEQRIAASLRIYEYQPDSAYVGQLLQAADVAQEAQVIESLLLEAVPMSLVLAMAATLRVPLSDVVLGVINKVSCADQGNAALMRDLQLLEKLDSAPDEGHTEQELATLATLLGRLQPAPGASADAASVLQQAYERLGGYCGSASSASSGTNARLRVLRLLQHFGAQLPTDLPVLEASRIRELVALAWPEFADIEALVASTERTVASAEAARVTVLRDFLSVSTTPLQLQAVCSMLLIWHPDCVPKPATVSELYAGNAVQSAALRSSSLPAAAVPQSAYDAIWAHVLVHIAKHEQGTAMVLALLRAGIERTVHIPASVWEDVVDALTCKRHLLPALEACLWSDQVQLHSKAADMAQQLCASPESADWSKLRSRLTAGMSESHPVVTSWFPLLHTCDDMGIHTEAGIVPQGVLDLLLCRWSVPMMLASPLYPTIVRESLQGNLEAPLCRSLGFLAALLVCGDQLESASGLLCAANAIPELLRSFDVGCILLQRCFAEPADREVDGWVHWDILRDVATTHLQSLFS